MKFLNEVPFTHMSYHSNRMMSYPFKKRLVNLSSRDNIMEIHTTMGSLAVAIIITIIVIIITTS